MRKAVSRQCGRRGNAAIEFALSFVLLWILLCGVFQLGYATHVYASLAAAVAEGAHYASRVDFDEPGHSFVGNVKNMTVYGNPTGTGSPLAPGLSTGMVNVTWTTDAAGVPQTLSVSISSYTVHAIKNYTYTNKPLVTVKFVGAYKTPG